MDIKLVNRLRKIMALAERGVGGEKETAQRMLDRLLRKHGLSLADISDDAVEMHWFKFRKGGFSKKLLNQVIYAVCGDRDTWKGSKKRYFVGVKCSEYERLQIALRFAVYEPAMEKEISVAFDAFVQVNQVFYEGETDSEATEDVDVEYLEKLGAMASSMKKVPVHEALPEAI